MHVSQISRVLVTLSFHVWNNMYQTTFQVSIKDTQYGTMLESVQGTMKASWSDCAEYPWWHCNPWRQVSVGNRTSCCCSVWLFLQRSECWKTQDLSCSSCQLHIVEAVWETLHTQRLLYTETNTHLSMQQSTLSHTSAHRHTETETHAYSLALLCLYHTQPHALLHATLKQPHILCASSDDLSNRQRPVKTGLKQTVKPLSLHFYKLCFVQTVC